MAFKQPRVPQYRSGEGVEAYLQTLILYLKDFCHEAWTANRQTEKGIAGLTAQDVGALEADYEAELISLIRRWNINTNKNACQDADNPGQSGLYHCNASTAGTKPSTHGELIHVTETPRYSEHQIFLTSTGSVWHRHRNNGGTAGSAAWSAWARHMPVGEIYPVGAVYLSTASTSPASLFGGTWEQLKDRFLLGAGSTYTAAATGGAATVTLTTSQIPAHKHTAGTLSGALNLRGDGDAGLYKTTTATGVFSMADPWSTTAYAMNKTSLQSGVYHKINFSATPTINNAGGGGSHNNMPPYLVVYMWKRVS